MNRQATAIAKPARLIERQSARIRDLEAEVARLAREVDRVSAEERAATSHAEHVDRLYREERDARFIADGELASVAAERDAGFAERDRARADEAESAITELRTWTADVEERERAIVDRDKDRMRRRELTEANAILNRAAVRGLVPGVRR